MVEYLRTLPYDRIKEIAENGIGEETSEDEKINLYKSNFFLYFLRSDANMEDIYEIFGKKLIDKMDETSDLEAARILIGLDEARKSFEEHSRTFVERPRYIERPRRRRQTPMELRRERPRHAWGPSARSRRSSRQKKSGGSKTRKRLKKRH
jgi:hypothetical protein